MTLIEKILALVPTSGKMMDPSVQHVRQFYSFQRDDVLLPEATDYPAPDFSALKGLQYDSITDEYYFEPEPELPAPGYPHPISLLFCSVVAVSLLRSVLTVRWHNAKRKLVTLSLGGAPRPIHNYRRFRDAFNNQEMFASSPFKNHNHGTAAGHRLAAYKFTDTLCASVGLEPYSFSMSTSEQSLGIAGERLTYWTKDTAAEPQFDPVTRGHLIRLIDVDYYMDMPDHLARYAQPHLVYTMLPTTAGTIGEDYSYSFGPGSVLTMQVSGGATYHHQLWNYGTDQCVVSNTIFGIPYKTVLYDVQSQVTSPDKGLVLLSPIRIFYGLSAIWASWNGAPLSRLKTDMGKFSKVVTYKRGIKTVSVAPHHTETSATVLGSVFDGLIATRNNAPKQQVSNYQVKSFLPDEQDGAPRKDVIAPILTEYLNNARDSVVSPVILVDLPRLIRLAFTVPDVVDGPAMIPFAAPFGVPPAFVPMNNKDSSDQSIHGRVFLPAEDSAEILGEFKNTPLKANAMLEFVKRLVPTPHKMEPFDYTETAEKQTKPGQQKDLQESGVMGEFFSTIIKTFMKKEAYGKPTDPRNISTFPPSVKIPYACFMYPLMDHLKSFSFYAFGRTPLGVAERVAAIASISDTVDCPDISRMDGYVNYFCRSLELAIGLRAFKPEYSDAFAASHKQSYDNKAVTTHGSRYDQGPSRGSGEMGTSAWNTIINLFIIFYSQVVAGKSFDEAWKFLLEMVIAGGDDGLIGNAKSTDLIRAARDVGFVLKCPTFTRSDASAGVNFLARVYGPEVWNGDPTSMCSLRRQMEKFHLTPSVPLSAAQKAFEKAISFMCTDANTPLIGALCRKILELMPNATSTRTITRWGDDVPMQDQYPNGYASWMDDVVPEELPLTNAQAFCEWLSNVESMAELLACPPFYETGREFTYSDWAPDDGIVISKTRAVLIRKKGKDKKVVKVKGTPSATEIRFGENGDAGSDASPADSG
jgi:hypothetical protein